MKRRKGIYYQRKLRRLQRNYGAGALARHQLQASILGWINYVRYGNTVGLRKAILRAVRIKHQRLVQQPDPARLQVLEELAAQAQALDMGY